MNENEIRRIFIEHSDSVYRLAFSQMKNKAEADDIFSETFLRLVRHQEEFESEEHIRRWLLRVTLNLCRSHFRSVWHGKTVSLEEIDSTEAATIFETIQQRETYLTVSALPKKYRCVIHLYYYEGYSVAEIANITDSRPGTVMSQLSRAREMLRKKLGEEFSYEH